MMIQSLDARPLVTIAIACFNAESTIERAIESAKNQDWPNIEILVVDDGSEDGSATLIEAFAKKDKRIRLIAHEVNQGVAVARNILIEHARGEFIAFFDADDVSYPERISLQYQRLTHHEQEKGADLILCYAGVRIIPVQGKPFEKKGIGHRPPEPVGQEYIGHYIPVKSHMKKCVWGYCGSGALFTRRAVFDRVGSFDASLHRAEDADYAIRAGLKGARFISVDQPLFDWHITEADYKSNKKELYYQLLMYGKYSHLFPNKISYLLSLQRIRATVGFDFSKKKGRYLLMLWYFGWASLCYLLVSPRVFSNRAWDRLENIFINRRANGGGMTATEGRQMMPSQSLDVPPLITIAIPCFNAEPTIERAIKSAQNQDWPNTEILIVDDGSEDGSGALIETIAKKDKKIRLIAHEANQGLSVVRNTAIAKARGEFIAFFDADDVSYSERVSLQYQRLTDYEQEKKVDLVLCYGGVRGIPLRGKPFEEKGIGYRAPEPVGLGYVGHYIPLNHRVKKCAWGHSAGAALFMRRAVFDRIGLFDASLHRAEDTDYTIRAGLEGAHFISVNQPLIDWHITEADYKSNKKELYYQFLMYGKYSHLFPNKISYFLSLQRIRATVGFDFAKKKRQYLLMAWYFGWASLCYLLVSPRVFSNRAWYRLENIFRNRRANKVKIMHPQAGK